MGDLIRSNTRDDDPDAWATAPAPAKVDAEARLSAQAEATEMVAHAVHQITEGMADLEQYAAGAIAGLADVLDYAGMAHTVAWVHDMRTRLGLLESWAARELGRTDGCPDVITLPDGRLAEVLKGKDRKAWRHDDWKRDVRNALLSGINDLFVVVDGDGATLEPAQVFGPLMAQAQAVHGSTAPKVTALKALGLSADDYCESYPGPYSVKFSAPATPTESGE